MINIKFPDGSDHQFESGVSAYDVIMRDIGEGLARAAVAVKFNGTTTDVTTPLTTDGDLVVLTFKDEEGKEIFRHSAAHVLAIAVKRVFPAAHLTIGPSIENGFYYDIDVENPFTPEDLEKIQSEMKKVVKAKLPFTRKEVSKEEALELMKDNPYKVEMINELPDGEVISIYSTGDEFVDLCRGPHVPNTGAIKAFKVLKASGAFWRGDAKNKQLQRIYGTAFPNKDDLKAYLHMMEEAEKRDHRKIGKRMNLFSFHKECPGMPFFKPNGMVMWNLLMDYWREVHGRWDYQETKTPIMLDRTLWETSGHWENYRENMYTLKVDDMDYAIKPMNCPGGLLIYNEDVKSYRDLPIRAGEVGLVHRHEASGALSGMFRVRCFHQDDAHIFMRPDQIKDEILGVLEICDEVYSTFGLSYHLELSTKPDKAIGSDEAWDLATNGLKDALDATGREYVINEGDGAFYGPKIDIHLKDAIGRTWQCGTIQLDMNLPGRFGLSYIAEDNSKKEPVMIHRVVYGSMERFFGILVEHFAGKFPLWLAPVQVKILPIADRHIEECNKLKAEFRNNGIRVDVNVDADTTNKKVRDAQLENVPLILVVGDKEIENKTVAVRTLDGKNKFGVPVDEFISKVQAIVKAKDLEFEF